MKIHHLAARLALFFLLLAMSAPAKAEMRPVRKLRAGIPPYQIIGEIMRGNARTGKMEKPADKPAAPFLTWLADSDARLQTTMLLPRPEGRIFVVRNLGNQLLLSVGAVDYGVRELHTPVLLITGNTTSQPIRLFVKGYKKLGEAMRQDLDHLYLPLQPLTLTGAGRKKESDRQRWLRLTEQNVDYQVAQAVRRYRDRVGNGRLVVVGGVLDLDNRYGFGRGRLILINVNTQTEPQRLRRLQHLKRLDPALLRQVGRKPATGNGGQRKDP